jgi:hypothetical protein
MGKKELIPPEKWEGLKAALEDASGGKKSTPRRQAAEPAKTRMKSGTKPVDGKKKGGKEPKKKDKKDKKKRKKKEKRKRKTGK